MVHALSRQEDTATSLSATTNLVTWQQWKQLYPVVCVRLHHCAVQPPANSLLSESKQQMTLVSFLFTPISPSTFYSVLLFTLWASDQPWQDKKVKLTAVCSAVLVTDLNTVRKVNVETELHYYGNYAQGVLCSGNVNQQSKRQNLFTKYYSRFLYYLL